MGSYLLNIAHEGVKMILSDPVMDCIPDPGKTTPDLCAYGITTQLHRSNIPFPDIFRHLIIYGKKIKDFRMASLPELLTVKMDLHNLLFISYLVSADRIRQLVPPELTSSTLNNKVFKSIVDMQCKIVHLFNWTWPRFN